MSYVHPAWVEHQRKRWMRPDADRYWRHDRERYFKPGVLDGNSAFERSRADARDVEYERAFDDELPALRHDHAALRHAFAEVKAALLARKAGFDPNQPRVPAGNPDGGQWTDAGGGGGSRGSGDSDSTEFSSARQVKPGSSDNVEKPSIGHNQGPPLDLPPRLPDKPPASAQELNAFLKAAAQWIARARKVSGPVGVFLGVLDALSWLDTDRPFIDAYLDEPKSLEELQRAVSEPKAGYHIHHIIEQTSAEQDGFSRELIDGVENRVRISALKHWKITAWYATKNDDFGGLSPRDYLRGKSWDERKKVGYDVLVRFEVLKP